MEIAEKIKKGWEVSAEGYSNIIQYDLKKENADAWRDLILGKAPKEGTLNILDIGTGPGLFSIILSMAGHNVTGIDFSPNMIEEAKKNAAYYGVSPEFLVMDSQEPTLPEGKFDIIVMRNVVWCLSRPKEAYANWKKLLSPIGRLLIIDGDHLRDLRDEEYKKMRSKVTEKYIETFKEKPPVSYKDFEVARGWRRELPLVGYPRPKWDIDTLTELGYKNITVDDVWDIAYTDEKRRLLHENDTLFMLTAER